MGTDTRPERFRNHLGNFFGGHARSLTHTHYTHTHTHYTHTHTHTLHTHTHTHTLHTHTHTHTKLIALNTHGGNARRDPVTPLRGTGPARCNSQWELCRSDA